MRVYLTLLAVAIILAAPHRAWPQDKSAAEKPADTVKKYAFPIRGAVYLDQNGNGTRDASEPGLEGIAVSDGLEVVMTDAKGAYVLPNGGKDAAFVYVHQPGNIKQTGQGFYHLLKNAGEGFRADFGLPPDNESKPGPAGKNKDGDSVIRFVQITDVHMRNPSDRAYMQEAIAQIYEMDPIPDFIVATGDLVDWAVDEHYRNYVAGMGKPPLPYFNVFGNHELVFGPLERYHQYVGPDYYSFEQKGVLFLALNCVTSSARQDAWRARTLELLGKDRPVVVLQHFPPSVEELEHFGEMGVRSVFSGHWHSEKEMEHAGVQSFNSPPFIMGGIDASPAGFKVVNMGPDGRATTSWRYGFQDRALTLVSPGTGADVPSGEIPLLVNAYDSSEEIAGISWEVKRQRSLAEEGNSASGGVPSSGGEPAGAGRLTPESALSWTGAMNLDAGTYLLRITVTGKEGTVWGRVRELSVGGSSLPEPSPGDSWPMFMGNSGHEGFARESIGKMPLHLIWSRDTGGDPDFSSPIMADGRIYLALKKRTGGRTNGVAAFDPLTGKKLWEFETDLAVNHTPAFWKGTLCIAEMGGRIIGLDAATGMKKWEHSLIDEHGRYVYGAPTAADGFFYAGVMRRMAKINAETGQLAWEKQAGPLDNDWISSYGSPAVSGDYVAMSGMYFVGEALAVLRADDGSPLWRHQSDNGMLASATISGDEVYFTSFKSVLYARNIHNGDSIWDRQLGEAGGDGKWSATTPAVKRTGKREGTVVAGSGDGSMYGVDLATGAIKWKHTSGPAVFKMSPYRRDDRPLLSSPTIAGDQVFFGSADGHIYCLDIETGEELWSFKIGVPVMSTPFVTGNMLYVAAYDGRLYAFTAVK